MIYIKLCGRNTAYNLDKLKIECLFLEISDKGYVSREIGFGTNNTIIHKCPSEKHNLGKFGIFEFGLYESPCHESNISKDEFEKAWQME